MAGKVTGRGRGGGRKRGGTVTQLPGTRRREAGNGGDGRSLTTVDNMTPEEREAAAAKQRQEREEAEAIQLISVVSRIKAQDVKVEAKRAELKTEQDALNSIFRSAKAQSKDFTRERLRELVEDSKPKLRKDVVEAETIRARFRRVMGLPVGLSDTERELEARLPEVERNGTFWRAAGYSAGLTGEFCEPPEECVRGGFDNLYAEGHKDGLKVHGDAMISKMGKPKNTPAAPEETAAQRKAREANEAANAKASLEKMGDANTAKDVGAQAAADFAKDNPGADTSGGAATDTVQGGPALDDVQASVKAATGGDGFQEATPEELAAQAHRPVREDEATPEPEAV